MLSSVRRLSTSPHLTTRPNCLNVSLTIRSDSLTSHTVCRRRKSNETKYMYTNLAGPLRDKPFTRIMGAPPKEHTTREIRAPLKAINSRLTIDRIAAAKIKRDKTFTSSTRLIDATWRKSLRRQGIPHQDWLILLQLTIQQLLSSYRNN